MEVSRKKKKTCSMLKIHTADWLLKIVIVASWDVAESESKLTWAIFNSFN